MDKSGFGGAMERRSRTGDTNRLVQLALFTGLLATSYFSWDNNTRLQAKMSELEIKIGQIESREGHATATGARVEMLEIGRAKHEARLETLERGSLTHVHETRATLRQLSDTMAVAQKRPSRSMQPHQTRQLQEASNDEQDVATIRVNAPDGVSQFVLGEKAAADNVIMEKEHSEDGAAFSIYRNNTRVMGIEADGGVTIHTDPLTVAGMVRTADGSPLHLQGWGGVNLQSIETIALNEVDGEGTWASQHLKIYAGDSIAWSWTNYHNVLQTDSSGIALVNGASSGAPMLMGQWSHTFTTVGTYYFKSQTQYSMVVTVEVAESFNLHNGTLNIGGDVNIGGALTYQPGPEFASEIKMFLANECPTGWTEATELKGYMLMGRPEGAQVNDTSFKNRPMDATERGRTHSAYYKGNTAYGQSYDSRYFGGYYSAYGTSASAGCTGPSCSYCRLPGASGNVNCQENFAHYGDMDYYYSANGAKYYKYDKLTNPEWATEQYMGPIGEYYPFAYVLNCKRMVAV